MVRLRHRLVAPLAAVTLITLGGCGGSGDSSSPKQTSSGATGPASAAGSSSNTSRSHAIGDQVKTSQAAFIRGSDIFGKKHGEMVARVDTSGLPKRAGLLVTVEAKLKNGKTTKKTVNAVAFRPGEPVWAESPVTVDADVASVKASATYSGEPSSAPDVEPTYSNFRAVDKNEDKLVQYDVKNPGAHEWTQLTSAVICFDSAGKPVAAGTGLVDEVAPHSTSTDGSTAISGDAKGARCSAYAGLISEKAPEITPIPVG